MLRACTFGASFIMHEQGLVPVDTQEMHLSKQNVA